MITTNDFTVAHYFMFCLYYSCEIIAVDYSTVKQLTYKSTFLVLSYSLGWDLNKIQLLQCSFGHPNP
jgi:hypothetical protein